jgi:hypothetical protein
VCAAHHEPVAKPGNGTPSPFVSFDRASWRALAASTPLPLAPEEITRLRGLGDMVDTAEVATVADLWSAQSRFLGSGEAKVPFVIAVAGSVAVGKSTTARILGNLRPAPAGSLPVGGEVRRSVGRGPGVLASDLRRRARGGHAHRESGHPDPGRPQRPTPTRSRAKLILHMAGDHSVRRVLLRKI